MIIYKFFAIAILRLIVKIGLIALPLFIIGKMYLGMNSIENGKQSIINHKETKEIVENMDEKVFNEAFRYSKSKEILETNIGDYKDLYETNKIKNINKGFVANEKRNNKPVIIVYENEYKESHKKHIINKNYADKYEDYNKRIDRNYNLTNDENLIGTGY